MRVIRRASLALYILSLCGLSHADFKYTQQSKITGGALMSMTKTLGVFSKSMRQINEPQTSITMLKGNRLREEHPTGEIQIIDLDARRFIYIDPSKKAYSVTTFDEFKAALQRAQQRAKEEQAKQMAKNPQAQNVKITPKFDAKVTGASRDVLGVAANEILMTMEMEIQSDDPKVQQQMQSASYTFRSDSWMAPSVPGYNEVHEFYLKMAKELDWLPGMMGGMTGMSMGNPQMGPAMEEFRKNAAKVKGMPLLQTVSIGMAAEGVAPAQGQTPQAGNQAQTQQQQQQQQQSQQRSQDNSVPTTPSQAVAKSLGGMFGGFGKKKKQEQPQQQTAQNSSGSGSGAAPGQPASASGSLMDMTIEVTSFSHASLDQSLFDVPAGYTQVQKNPDDLFGGRGH